MPENDNEKPETTDAESLKPTITIAEKQGGAASDAVEKPTITIAESNADSSK